MTLCIATKRANELISISLILISSLLVIQMSGCGGHVYHVVEPGETLYSIGWLYGYDYRQIAQWNNIPSPYALRKGQRLRVAPVRGDASSNTSINGKASAHSPQTAQVSNASDDKKGGNDLAGPRPQSSEAATGNDTVTWAWPLKGGKLVQTFNAQEPGSRGIDLIGYEGQPVYSVAGGRVVYSGGGLPQYGKLVIIKHSDEFLSAYAHNQRLRVKEGDQLQAGEHIADMGRNNANKIVLHFEIRRNGKPVDPLEYLPKRTR